MSLKASIILSLWRLDLDDSLASLKNEIIDEIDVKIASLRDSFTNTLEDFSLNMKRDFAVMLNEAMTNFKVTPIIQSLNHSVDDSNRYRDLDAAIVTSGVSRIYDVWNGPS
jgi:hypothetical protein